MGLLLFLLALSVLFGAQLFFYISIVKFFSVTDAPNRFMLYIATALTPIFFILASVLATFKENVVVKYFYIVSGILLGIGANFVIASVGVWLSIFFLRLTSPPVSVPVVAVLGFALAFFASCYGIWNTRNPIIKRIEVIIPHLPEWWRGKRIVQLSDIHLGYVYQPNFMKRVSERVDALEPDLVVITGDLFDGMDGDLDRSIEPINSIRAREGIFFVTGNHETYLGLERTYELLARTKIRVLRDEVVDIRGLKVIGIEYPDRQEQKDVVGVARRLAPSWQGYPNILLYHSPAPSVSFEKLGVNLQLSGHTHRGQIFPFNLVTKLLFHGRDYGLHVNGSYSLYTTSGVGTWGPSMRIGNRPEIVEITLR